MTDQPMIKQANMNIKQYCNVVFPYTDIKQLNRDVILADMRFWRDICAEYDAFKGTPAATTAPKAGATTKSTTGAKTAAPKAAATKSTTPPKAAPAADVPAGFTKVAKCSKCGADFANHANYIVASGTANGRTWYAMDCTQCKTPAKSGKGEYPTRNFLKGDIIKANVAAPATPIEEAAASTPVAANGGLPELPTDFDALIPEDALVDSDLPF